MERTCGDDAAAAQRRAEPAEKGLCHRPPEMIGEEQAALTPFKGRWH